MQTVSFGLTSLIALIYMVLIGLAVFAFIKKKIVIGIALSVLCAMGIIALAILWFTSPM
ncbi:MAG: hypothetical protein II046_07305 [Clostridiales bacterium]|jgi:hypothetical protein|nr:hypothetical protein [Clostridiales bacterium]MBQ2156379.1 hypothetical protein [Clostridiales bacterium]